MVRQEWGRMWVDGEGVGILSLGRGRTHCTRSRPTLETGAAASCTEGLPPFMALFVSPRDRRVAGETDRVCSAQAARDSRAVMTHLR